MLYNEAENIVQHIPNWHPKFKEQFLLQVVDRLEQGRWVRTENGAHTVPYKVSEVAMIISQEIRKSE